MKADERVVAPIVAGVAILAVWEGALLLLDPQGFVLPRPTEIAAAVVEERAALADAARNTGFVVVSGLVAGVVMGGLTALLVTRSSLADRTLTPLAVAVNAIPIIALAPIFNNWFGLTSPRSNQAIVAILVFFPVFINTARGLTQVERAQLELMSTYAAGPWRTTVEVRIPNALPFFFTALKLASSLAVIGAIVAEYFGGRQDALGPIITQSAGLTRYDEAWAAVAVGSAIGLALYAVVVITERLVAPWATDDR